MYKNSYSKIILALQELFDDHSIDKGHGVDHARKVFCHAENSLLFSKEPRNKIHRHAIKCASLLHDADDKKFFPDSKDYQNAREIMQSIFPREKELETLTIKMIDLVSCSDNGNSSEKIKETEKWMLIPRLCDRLEAIGDIGILRTWIYSKHKKRPMFLPHTFRVTTEKELYEVATPERFETYLSTKESESMIDHFYDKLFHICSEKVISEIDIPYIKTEMRSRRKIIEKFIFNFGKYGNIDIIEINRIRAKELK